MSREQERPAPGARQEGLVVERLGEELLVYDEASHRSHCLNRPAALVWENCDGRATASDIARRVGAELGMRVAEPLVWLALEDLGRRGLLKEKPRTPRGPARMSRRELMRRLGVAAVLIPVIVTVTAPTAYAAVSCSGTCTENGAPCGGNPSCVCINNVCVPA